MSPEFKFRALTGEDWKEINEGNLIYDKDGLKLKNTERDGTYISEMLDSGISGCFWHRIVLDADIHENSTITVSFITSETEEAVSSSGFCNILFTKAEDALIQAPHGRYIRMIIEFHREGEKSPVLRQVKVYYERISYLRYLPAIYQENSESKDFLERFLSIFESSMYDSEDTISSIPVFFDPMAAPEDFYRWLADWLSLDLYDQLEDKNREFILRAVELYRKKGTVSGLSDLVTVLTGKKCCIKEYKNNVFRSWGMEHEDKIYSDNETSRCLEYETDPKYECMKFRRNTSKTLDTSDLFLMNNRGKNKYCDEVHYVFDASDGATYSPNVIGIFIFLQENEKFELVDKYEEQLYKIINSFLPVFVRPKIYIVVVPYIENYDKDKFSDKYYDSVHTSIVEKFSHVIGYYKDEPNWKWIHSFDNAHPDDIKITNNVGYRTYYSGIGQENPL